MSASKGRCGALRCACATAIALATAGVGSTGIFAQSKPAAPVAQKLDADYTARIKAATADPRILTELVDHMPASEKVRDMFGIAVADEATIRQLDKYRQITAQLTDPRKLTDAQAKQLIATGKPIYFASGSIHSPETGSPEMLMELAYRLAVEESWRSRKGCPRRRWSIGASTCSTTTIATASASVCASRR